MRRERLDAVNHEKTVAIDDYFPRQVSPVVALRELYELLEEYSPMWYSQETHDLARAALRQQPAQ